MTSPRTVAETAIAGDQADPAIQRIANIARAILAEAPPEANEFGMFTDCQGKVWPISLDNLRAIAALSTPPQAGTEGETPALQADVVGWQDISTAPKNTKVLAGYFNEAGKWRTVTACYHTRLDWSDEYGDHEQEYAPEDWYEENDSSEVIYPCRCRPTHWQPLPAPLAATEGSANV